ncbi:MAG: paraquat-inducible protein A [Bacteriovorax sp.]|nr:paraquat-inducible protein A [Bacteriovorax sp.]
MLNKQLEQYLNQTFETQDTSQLSKILLKTETRDIESARIKLHKRILVLHEVIYKEAILLILLSVFLFGMTGLKKQPLIPSQYILLVLSLIILLIAGVTTPMIDMDAKISQMNFVLMGHPVHFENQVLYFQSKSILDVFWIMITNKAIQMKLVGILMITFSIFIPLFKIVSSVGYYYNFQQAKENAVIKFLVLKSGKWSMADVMVIAIFMAYIGFNGIITSQLGKLSSEGQELVILTTNGTSLQPGYYLFLTYTLLALFLSEFLTRKPTS